MAGANIASGHIWLTLLIVALLSRHSGRAGYRDGVCKGRAVRLLEQHGFQQVRADPMLCFGKHLTKDRSYYSVPRVTFKCCYRIITAAFTPTRLVTPQYHAVARARALSSLSHALSLCRALCATAASPGCRTMPSGWPRSPGAASSLHSVHPPGSIQRWVLALATASRPLATASYVCCCARQFRAGCTPWDYPMGSLSGWRSGRERWPRDVAFGRGLSFWCFGVLWFFDGLWAVY